MPLGCLPYGKCYQGLVSKWSRPGSQASGRPVHVHPVLSTKRKWRLSTYHQPSYSKPFLGEGVLQDEGTASSKKSLIHQGDFIMKLDLKDAYYALPIHHSHRKYLRFVYQDRTYEFQCLPFGLSSAPRAFTKTLKSVLTVLRSMGIRVVIYTDDMLLLHQQCKVLQKIFAQVVDLLETLGFLVKKEKCSSIPCQRLIFLGAVLDSTTMTLSLPPPKLTSIVDTCHHLLAQGSGSVRTLSTLIRQMRHASQTGILVAPLHYRGLQRLYLQAVSQHG